MALYVIFLDKWRTIHVWAASAAEARKKAGVA
jgi:hypothetical protein